MCVLNMHGMDGTTPLVVHLTRKEVSTGQEGFAEDREA